MIIPDFNLLVHAHDSEFQRRQDRLGAVNAGRSGLLPNTKGSLKKTIS